MFQKLLRYLMARKGDVKDMKQKSYK